MKIHSQNNFPKLHNAMWPGIIGKGHDSEAAFDLDAMLDFTASAAVDGMKFDGVDLFLCEPHVSIDASSDDLKRIADKISGRGLVAGSVVAPVWQWTGGGSAMGSTEDRRAFVEQVRKSCRIAQQLRELGVRPYGVIRVDSATSVADWENDPQGTQKIAQTFRESAEIAEGYGEVLAAEGEICWGGMHSWREMVRLLEEVARPGTFGFQADMAHTLLYILGHNREQDRLVPDGFNWESEAKAVALTALSKALRPWTIDFHVAQNDATVKEVGLHEKTGRHCLPDDPSGKLHIPQDAGYWLRDESGTLTKRCHHICWDGCMFSNETMQKPATWYSILKTMVAVRDAHGWHQ